MKAHHAHTAFSPLRTATGPASQARPEVATAAPIVLVDSMSVRQAFFAIATNCLDQIHGNEAGVAFGADPESVHQMRVGLRRMRSALRLFRDVASPSPALRNDIDGFFSRLSEVRDWEVLAGLTLPLVESGANRNPELESLRKSVLAIARTKRRKASALVRSVRFSTTMRALNVWVVQLGESAAAAMTDIGEEDIGDFADRLLSRERQRLLRRGRNLRDGDARTRHRLRIAAKRARYACEFLATLYPAKRMKAYSVPLLALQDYLGRLNDFAVADRLLSELSAAEPTLVGGAAYARGYLTAETVRQCRKLAKRWKHVKRAVPPVQHR